MKSDQDAYARLERALKRAFGERERVKPGEQWQQQVMSHIRSLGPLKVKASSVDIFEQFLWRLTPVAGVLIVIVTVCIFNLDLVPEYEMVKLFVEEPFECSYVPMLGV